MATLLCPGQAQCPEVSCTGQLCLYQGSSPSHPSCTLCRYHSVLFPVTAFVCEMLLEGQRESSRAELFFEDLEKMAPTDVARISEWLTERVDSFSAKLKPEAKELLEVRCPAWLAVTCELGWQAVLGATACALLSWRAAYKCCSCMVHICLLFMPCAHRAPDRGPLFSQCSLAMICCGRQGICSAPSQVSSLTVRCVRAGGG